MNAAAQPSPPWRDLFRLSYDELHFFLHERLPRILLTLLLAFLLIRLLNGVSRRLARVQAAHLVASSLRVQQLHTLGSIVRSVGVSVIVFFASVTVLYQLGIRVEPLLASAGIAGLAVGFGAQTLVHDVLNGFFILAENWFDVGDEVRIGSFQGAVEMLTLRRTVLRDANGSVHMIPNSTITVVSNLTRDWSQLTVEVSVEAGQSSDRMIELLTEVALALRHAPGFADAIVADPLVPGIDRLAGGEARYLLLLKTRPGQQYAVGRELRRRIQDCLERKQIRPGSQNRYFAPPSEQPPH